MSITSILGTALKNLPWRTIANAAMEHAPDFYQKVRERFQKSGENAGETAAEARLQARIARLEGLLLEQDAVIRQQTEKGARLEEKSAALEASLTRFKIVSGVLFVTTIILLALLMK